MLKHNGCPHHAQGHVRPSGLSNPVHCLYLVNPSAALYHGWNWLRKLSRQCWWHFGLARKSAVFTILVVENISKIWPVCPVVQQRLRINCCAATGSTLLQPSTNYIAVSPPRRGRRWLLFHHACVFQHIGPFPASSRVAVLEVLTEVIRPVELLGAVTFSELVVIL